MEPYTDSNARNKVYRKNTKEIKECPAPSATILLNSVLNLFRRLTWPALRYGLGREYDLKALTGSSPSK